MAFKAKIHITLKNGVLDPQGKAIAHALDGLGFGGIRDVRQGKYIEIVLDDRDVASAESRVRAMCDTLLANTVIENYRVDIEPGTP
jgi:phosphoribosylformylglycinamidine synthase